MGGERRGGLWESDWKMEVVAGVLCTEKDWTPCE